MNCLVYIVIKTVKNRVTEIFRKPSKLILYLLVIGLIVFTLVLNSVNRPEAEEISDIIWLKGMFLAMVLMFFIIAVIKGLKSGDMIFSMNDVNFLFVSPLNPQKILLYGVVRMMGMSLLAGIFILFQGGTLSVFGIRPSAVFLIFAVFILALSLMQILSLVIYSLTNGKPKRKLIVKAAAAAIFLPMACVFAASFVQTGDVMNALAFLLNSPVTDWTPVTGWAAEGMIALVTGDAFGAVLFLGIIAATGALLIIYIMMSNPDYYEDVLVASETAFEKKRAMSEGQVNIEGLSDKKVRVTNTGIGGGGPSAVFYKHLRESFRANRLGLWGTQSIIMIAGAAIFAAIMNINQAESIGFITMLQVLMWLQVFLIGTGRGLKELYSHYIYMIPEPPFVKIVWSNIEIVLKVFVESLFIFGIACVIMRESPLLAAAAVVVYVIFSFMLLGVNYFFLRFTDTDMSAGILMFLYIIVVMLLMLPGLIAAIIVGSTIENWGTLIGLYILATWEFIVAAGCFALSMGILHKCDMPSVNILSK